LTCGEVVSIDDLPLGADRLDVDHDDLHPGNSVGGKQRCGSANQSRPDDCDLTLPDHGTNTPIGA
jgi:hypothetical protein